MTSLIRRAKLDKIPRLLDPTLRSTVEDIPGTKPLCTGTGAGEALIPQECEIPDSQKSEGHAATSNTGEQTVFMESSTQQRENVPAALPIAQTYEDFREQFNEELTQQRTEAVKQGYNEGLQAGRETAMQETAQSREQLSALIAGMRAEYERDLDGIAEIGAEIVFEAVTRIIGSSYLDRNGIAAVVREVISHAKDRSRLVIRVSPADYQELKTAHEMFTENGDRQKVEILADDRVELGGCLLETPAGNLDGRLEVQLQQLRDTLLSARLHRLESVLQS
jgi:flagellar assembly protein FliH